MTQARVALPENISFDRIIRAVEKVKERLIRSTQALDRAGVPYAVIGGNAVAAWVSTVDEGLVRNTKDVDILVRRSDLATVKAAMTAAGFVHEQVLDADMFLDGPGGKPSQAVHIIFSGEYVKEGELAPAADVNESVVSAEGFRVVALEALLRMKLTSFRRKDQVHIQDIMAAELVDADWVSRFPPELGARLQQILDTPGG